MNAYERLGREVAKYLTSTGDGAKTLHFEIWDHRRRIVASTALATDAPERWVNSSELVLDVKFPEMIDGLDGR